MQKLIFLFLLVSISTFTACNGRENQTEEAPIDFVACIDDCQKACCLGCKATEGDKKCIFLEDGTMPCCVAKN